MDINSPCLVWFLYNHLSIPKPLNCINLLHKKNSHQFLRRNFASHLLLSFIFKLIHTKIFDYQISKYFLRCSCNLLQCGRARIQHSYWVFSRPTSIFRGLCQLGNAYPFPNADLLHFAIPCTYAGHVAFFCLLFVFIQLPSD